MKKKCISTLYKELLFTLEGHQVLSVPHSHMDSSKRQGEKILQKNSWFEIRTNRSFANDGNILGKTGSTWG